ncbi:MAG TPA: toxic anion resistance protein [Actinomycetota bacterium]|nr:toxic anion resistance protein [Actinomycetota bacterium]
MSTQSSELVLSPPQPIAPVSPAQADGMVELDGATKQRLDQTVDGYVDSLTKLDPNSPEMQRKVDSVHTLGDKEIRQSASVSNRMLDRPVRAMGSGLFDKNAPVAKSLVELRRTIDDLDPAKQGLFSKKKLFGLIPFGDRLRDYFAKYQSAQTHLNGILQSLYQGQDELRQDNAAIEQEKANLWTTMDRLKQYAYMAGHLDGALEAKIASLQAADPDKAKALQQEVLFYVRQKDQDLLTQLAVSAQGYLALELIRKNNVELIKGVDRATTTTVSALRTAVMVAQALANQRLVLDQITALNTTTENMIESTSEMLRDQSERVHEQAASSTIGVDKLQAAFDNVYASIDAIDSYKAQALDSMKQTVEALQTEVGKAQAYLERARGDDSPGGGELSLGT